MPELDASRLAVERAAKTIGSIRQTLKLKMPFGPGRVAMTRREAMRFLQNMDASTKQHIVDKMGSQEWDSLMERLYGKK